MKRVLEAAWWFLLGAVAMHMTSSFLLRPLLDAAKMDAKAGFFALGALILAALVIVGMVAAALFLTRRLRGAR